MALLIKEGNRMNRIQCYVSEETQEKIEEIASQNNMSISRMASILIEKGVDTTSFSDESKAYFDSKFNEIIEKMSVVLGLSHDIFRSTFDSEKSKFPSENAQDALQKLKENVARIIKNNRNDP